MWRREIALSTLTFALLFILQEALINQFNLPLGGFSVILLAALIWSSINEPEVAVITGFIAGIFMDLSPSTDGPFGQWILVLALSCYVISYLGYGDDALNSNPIGLILMTATAVITTILLYLFIGMLFGLNIGSTAQMIRSVIGFGLWSALIAPLIVPFISRAHSIIYSGSYSGK